MSHIAVGSTFTHNETSRSFVVLGKIEINIEGEWHPGVYYCPFANPTSAPDETYCRTLSDFQSNFSFTPNLLERNSHA